MAAVEEGDPEGTLRGEVRGEVGSEVGEVRRVEAEGEGVLLRNVEVGLQGPPDEEEGAPEDRPPEIIQHLVAGVVRLDGPGGLLQRLPVRRLPVRDVRVEAQTEQSVSCRAISGWVWNARTTSSYV